MTPRAAVFKNREALGLRLVVTEPVVEWPGLSNQITAAWDALPCGVFVSDADGRILYSNEAGAELVGFDSQMLRGSLIFDVVPQLLGGDGAEAECSEGSMAIAIRSGQILRGHQVSLGEGAARRLLSVDAMPVQGGNEATHYVVIAFVDITVHQAEKNNWHWQAMHDALTRLPNRRLFFARAHELISVAGTENRPLAVMMVDIDRFKEVNDSHGHACGDSILSEVGTRLAGELGLEGFVARLGGDEFAILLPGADGERALRLGRRLAATFDAAFTHDGQLVDVEASFGIAVYPGQGQDIETLTRRSDLAMYEAKRTSKSVVLFRPDQERRGRRVDHAELRRAIEQNELVLHFQPEVSVNGRQTKCVEALVRWHHGEHGMLYPGSFVPQAERSGMIKRLGDWVLNAALRQWRAWSLIGLDIPIAVNLSTKEAQDPDTPQRIATMLDTWGASPDRLKLEVTEDVVMAEVDVAIRVLEQLNHMGVRIAVDDFGSGFSSLAYLSDLPIHEIKIDKSFVLRMLSDEKSETIVRAAIELGHGLNLTVVAEGVESEAVLVKLQSLGCDVVQGFHISRGLPGSEIPEWLSAES